MALASLLDLGHEPLLLEVLNAVAPLRDVFRVGATCRRLHDAVHQQDRLPQEWATRLCGVASPLTSSLAMDLWSSCRNLAATDFSGAWCQQSFSREELLCKFDFVLESAPPLEWRDLLLKDSILPQPQPASASRDVRPFLLRRGPPQTPDPCLALKGYTGSGQFHPQEHWTQVISFEILGWSLGQDLFYEIQWDHGRLGCSSMRLHAQTHTDTAAALESSHSALQGRFVNHHVGVANFDGDFELRRRDAGEVLPNP